MNEHGIVPDGGIGVGRGVAAGGFGVGRGVVGVAPDKQQVTSDGYGPQPEAPCAEVLRSFAHAFEFSEQMPLTP